MTSRFVFRMRSLTLVAEWHVSFIPNSYSSETLSIARLITKDTNDADRSLRCSTNLAVKNSDYENKYQVISKQQSMLNQDTDCSYARSPSSK
jgi:hypothetical protein